ncbi:uncharacterized protein A1O5_11256, partial [Cladophialophora psammophila CBS 110553]
MSTQLAPKKLRIAINGLDSLGYDIKFSISARSETSIDRLHRIFSSQRARVDIITSDNVEAARSSEVVILAFQPQQLVEVLNSPALVETIRGKLVLSVLAGISSLQV